MSNIAAIQLEQSIVKMFEYMKHKMRDATKMPIFTSIGLEHLRDISKFVEDYADGEFLPWVAKNDPEGTIDAGGSPTMQKLSDDMSFYLTHLLAECGHPNSYTLEKLQVKFMMGYPWYVDDLHVTTKIVDMLIDESACEMKPDEDDE